MKKRKTIATLITASIIPIIISDCISTSEKYGNYINDEHKFGPFYLNKSYTEEKIKQETENSIDDEETARNFREVEIGFYIGF